MKDDEPSLSSMKSCLISFGFLTMLLMATYFTFYGKRDELIANRTQVWKVIQIKADPSFSYFAYANRSNGYDFLINKHEQSFYSDNCGVIKPFCIELKQGLVTPSSFDFYVRHDPANQPEAYNQYLLKSIHYLDNNQKLQHLERRNNAPNTPKALQKAKKSFTGFFIMTLFGYAFFLLIFYISTYDDSPSFQKIKMRIFKILTIGLTLFYLHFIIQFFINT